MLRGGSCRKVGDVRLSQRDRGFTDLLTALRRVRVLNFRAISRLRSESSRSTMFNLQSLWAPALAVTVVACGARFSSHENDGALAGNAGEASGGFTSSAGSSSVAGAGESEVGGHSSTGAGGTGTGGTTSGTSGGRNWATAGVGQATAEPPLLIAQH